MLHGVFHFVLRDWGLAIIGLVLLVRLRPASDHQEVAGAHGEDEKMGPEMEKLKKKYGDDKDELTKAMCSSTRSRA